MLKKDKQKVLDEVWTEDRIRGFLDLEAPAGVDRDFHRLLKAYQSMRADDFEKFISMAQAAGLNLAATSPEGETVADIVAKHKQSATFAAILKTASA